MFLRRFLTAILLASLAHLAWAAPTQLAVEGHLSSAAGGPVADGGYAMGFKLYADEKGVAPVFTELFLAVEVKSGLFAGNLGASATPLDGDLFVQGKAAWLGITVGGDPELPRVPLRRVPYAVHAMAATMAGDLQCSGCVTAGELAAGAVTSDAIAAGAVQPGHVAFAFAGADTKGGAALLAKTAETAKVADSAKIAEFAKAAGTADLAASAEEAKFAANLKCTGCVTASMLADAVVADLVTAGKLAKVAQSGQYADLKGGPDLTPYAQLGGVNKWSGAQTFNGGVILGGNQDFALNQALLFRFQTADKAPVPCDQKSIGLAYYDTVKQALLLCNGKTFKVMAAAGALGSSTSPAPSCKAILDAGDAAGDGAYWLDADGSGPLAAFQGYCDMTTEGGGWTRFLKLTDSNSYVGLAGVPNGQEYVDNGTFQFSTTMMKASNREVLIREKQAPFRLHKYDFKQGSNLAGDDFVGALTGDKGGTVAVWNWTTGAWQSTGTGTCNNNNHSQWNCTPPNGNRFHYATRDWVGDGGSSSNTTWLWFTGYENAYAAGNYAQLVKNWDGQYNKTPHELYFR